MSKKQTISEEFTRYATQELELTKEDLGFYVLNSILSDLVSEAFEHVEKRAQTRRYIWSYRLMSPKLLEQTAQQQNVKINTEDKKALKQWRREKITELKQSLKAMDDREKQMAIRIDVAYQLQKKLGVTQQTPQTISEEKQKEVTKKLVKLYQEFNF